MKKYPKIFKSVEIVKHESSDNLSDLCGYLCPDSIEEKKTKIVHDVQEEVVRFKNNVRIPSKIIGQKYDRETRAKLLQIWQLKNLNISRCSKKSERLSMKYEDEIQLPEHCMDYKKWKYNKNKNFIKKFLLIELSKLGINCLSKVYNEKSENYGLLITQAPETKYPICQIKGKYIKSVTNGIKNKHSKKMPSFHFGKDCHNLIKNIYSDSFIDFKSRVNGLMPKFSSFIIQKLTFDNINNRKAVRCESVLREVQFDQSLDCINFSYNSNSFNIVPNTEIVNDISTLSIEEIQTSIMATVNLVKSNLYLFTNDNAANPNETRTNLLKLFIEKLNLKIPHSIRNILVSVSSMWKMENEIIKVPEHVSQNVIPELFELVNVASTESLNTINDSIIEADFNNYNINKADEYFY